MSDPCFLIVILILALFSLQCEANEEAPAKIGNFALHPSQQPGPLIGFGENIIDKNETQLFLFADDYAGVKKHFVDVIPSVLYGIRSDLSIFINVPYAASFQEGQHKSRGFEDAFAQLEYAFYNKSKKKYVDQATLVVNTTIPTGSTRKDPATGFGAPSYFVGTTFNRTCARWFVFGSPGATFPTARHSTKFGNIFLYQFGFGRNIADVKNWILAWMIETDGIYTQKNRINGILDPNSGGNVVYITPSFWASTKTLIIQLGVGYAVTQHLNGNQTPDKFLLAMNLGWSFY